MGFDEDQMEGDWTREGEQPRLYWFTGKLASAETLSIDVPMLPGLVYVVAVDLDNNVDVNRGDLVSAPLRYEDEVEVLADGYRLLTGQEPPDGYAEATARPPDPHARSAPRAPASANAPPASARHQLADIPLYGAGLARPKRRRTPDARAAPAQNARGAAHDTPNGSGAAPPTASCAPPVTPPPSSEGGDTR